MSSFRWQTRTFLLSSATKGSPAATCAAAPGSHRAGERRARALREKRNLLQQDATSCGGCGPTVEAPISIVGREGGEVRV